MSTQVQQGYQGDGFGKVDGGFEIVEHNEISLTSTNPNGSTSNDDISMWGFGGVSKGTDLIGCRLELKWSSGRWYRGTISDYETTQKKHKVMYDDGDLRWYYLPEMVFRS
mmetsp:Transcript_10262/g.11668  ORF Transcript_10262/g.11668 Transcript_10262/m.11668 type:complete len:110 (+) Transcript_10262:494-823(+)